MIMKVRKSLILVLAAFMVLSLAVVTLADDEADVINTGAGNTRPYPNPGENFVVIQDVTIADPGLLGDPAPDTFPTAIETITIKKTAGSTLPDRFVTALRLYVDDGNGFFDLPADALLGEVANPDLTGGVTFGVRGHLLILVPDGGSVQFYVVADFSNEAPDNATLRTSFDVTAAGGLVGGPTTSSGFDNVTAPPILNFDAGLPVPTGFITITATGGDNETDIVDETPPVMANPGSTVVIQQLKLADPGASGDADDDNHPTLIRTLTVKMICGTIDTSRKLCGTVDTSKIVRLRLFKESPRTPPGFQETDELLGTIFSPDLIAGAMFGDGGRTLFRVEDGPGDNDGTETIIYIVADLAPAGFLDGDTFKTEVFFVARDDKLPGGEISSGIEVPQPIVASNPVTIVVPPATIIIGSAEILGPVKIPLSVKFVPEPGLGELQIGPVGAITFDPGIIEVKGVKGVGNYVVESLNIDNEAGKLQFAVTLKPGRKPINEGPVVMIELEPVPTAPPGDVTELKIEDEDGIEVVDVFRDAAGKDLTPDVVPGQVKIKMLMGDVDLDRAITAADARLVAQYILGLVDLEPEQLEVADVAPPLGVIDATDVRWIAQAAAGLRKLDPASAAAAMQKAAALNRLRAKSFVEQILAYPNPLGVIEFNVLGRGIAEIQVQVFNLRGVKIFEETVGGNSLSFRPMDRDGNRLSNGIYLYVVTVRSMDGRIVRSEVRKLVILK